MVRTLAVSILLVPAPVSAQTADAPFATSDTCLACHNRLVSPAGEDVSIGTHWRSSMMANAARDPYWQAAVQREVLDHPESKRAIEGECATCHMPMARFETRMRGAEGDVFAHLPIGGAATRADRLAADGVSCTVCHRISEEGLGDPASFTGRFAVDTSEARGEPLIYGPYDVDAGRATIMRSATGFRPARGDHVQQSELCASCHTLYTHSRGRGGEVIGELPEQVPYLEWRHSRYREEKSCQDCHMRPIEQETPISSVWGEPRPGLSRHAFRGGNFFVLRILSRHADELGVPALPQELELAARETVAHLANETARISVERAVSEPGRLGFAVRVENLAGHKLPTAYPSRRAWIHLTVRDGGGRVLFESGAFSPDGRVAGNDNDADPDRYEPHRSEIRTPDEVQVYEAILLDRDGAVTTGLLTATSYGKDNRLLPHGFDKATAEADIAVRGAAAADDGFHAGGDRVRYSVDVAGASGPFRVEAELWYQPIGYRWAENLRPYRSPLIDRFVAYYGEMSASSAVVLARSEATVE